jgi:beta propeller repeat protein
MNESRLRRLPLPAALGVALAACVALAAGMVLTLVPEAGAQGRQCDPGGYTVDSWQVSGGEGAAGAPATDGSVIVWADSRSGDWDIHAYDLEAEKEIAVRVAPGDQTDPVVACGQVYWVDRSGDAPVVWTLDPETEVASAVSEAGADQVAASERWVVWSAATPVGRDIVALDRESGATFVVCAAEGDQVRPAASDALIVWEDHRGGEEADIYAWDPCEEEEFAVSAAEGDQTDPAAYGTVVLWADDRWGDWDIFGSDASDLWTDWAETATAGARGCETGELEFVVSAGCGDQVAPAISGAMAFWTDFGCDEDEGDVRGADLTWGGAFAVAEGDGAQSDCAAAADGELAAWLDDAGGAPAVQAGRVAWREGDDGEEEPGSLSEWTTRDVVTLFLGVLADLDVFDEVRFAVDDGAYGDWQTLEDTEAVRLPSVDGVHVIHIQLADSELEAGLPGSEELPFEVSVTTTLDTHGPVTAARDVTVRRGKPATVRFRVRDNLSATADVTLVVRNRAGKVVKTVCAGTKATNTLIGKRFKADLRRGRYTVRVVASDLAGNWQRKAAAGVLVVR